MTHVDRRLSSPRSDEASPPRPSLDAEWRLVILFKPSQGFPTGYVHIVECASQEDAFAQGRKTNLTYYVERRYVTPWMSVTPRVRNAIVEEHGRRRKPKKF